MASGAASYLLAGNVVSGDRLEVLNGGSSGEATEETITGSDLGDFIYHVHDWTTIVMLARTINMCFWVFTSLVDSSLVVLILGGWAFMPLAFLLGAVLVTLLFKLDLLDPIISRRRRRRFDVMYA